MSDPGRCSRECAEPQQAVTAVIIVSQQLICALRCPAASLQNDAAASLLIFNPDVEVNLIHKKKKNSPFTLR